jgi:formate dehydrogenase major subunit
MQLSRRQFFKVAPGLTGSSLVAMGFAHRGARRSPHFQARTTETRNTCPYCSVGCGIIMYSLGDKAKNAHAEIFHIEGDPDHPVNRGSLCPKGAGLLDFSTKNRLKYPEVREPGTRSGNASAGTRPSPHRQAERKTATPTSSPRTPTA